MLDNNNYHFIAIGGIGMSGLAKYLLEQGKRVSGSDICGSKYLGALKEAGADIHIGHNERNLPENSIVVVSSAIKEDNPELIKAKRLKMPILHRSDLLAELSHINGQFIGFSGTHGKTTTSGLAAFVLSKANFKPSYLVGGIIPELYTNAHYDSGNYFIAELDESDGTIVKYRPDVLVINNLEADHIDFYTNGLISLQNTFKTYLSQLSSAKIIVNIDDKGIQGMGLTNVTTYALKNDADFKALNIKSENGITNFDVYKNKNLLANISLQIPGIHNVYNALAVIAAFEAAGCNTVNFRSYFKEFTGMGRRLQKVLEFNGIKVYDDYAHHPTEIKAVLAALKNTNPESNIIAVFQPHRYTRLKAFWNEFKNSFGFADRIIVTDVYAASEEEIEGINSREFVKGFDNAEYYSGSIADTARKLLPALKSGDIVAGLGAGTITELAAELKKAKEELLWTLK